MTTLWQLALHSKILDATVANLKNVARRVKPYILRGCLNTKEVALSENRELINSTKIKVPYLALSKQINGIVV